MKAYTSYVCRVADLSRRTFLRGTSTVAALGGTWVAGSPAAWAEAEGHGSDVHEQIVRDANMVWRRVPTGWDDGPFLGNGFLGVQVYRGPEPNVLRFMLSHSLVQDQRAQWEAAIGLSRLPIGYLTLTFPGAITGVDWTLELWNAELTGTVTTTQGSLKFSALVHNDRSTLLVSTTGDAEWDFRPMPSRTTRTIRVPPDYTANPAPAIGTAGEAHYAEQPLVAGGGYSTVWQTKQVGTQRLLAATVEYGHPDSAGLSDAITTIRRVLAAPLAMLVRGHRAWWNQFYTRSLVSVPDKVVQRFYWIQLYKMACATRANAPVVSEWGPWFPDGGGSWTAVWWNLNVQVAYPFINGSNHAELDAVTATFQRYHENLGLSVPPDYRDADTYALSHPGDRTLRSGGPKLGAAIPGNATVGVPGTGTKTDQTGNLLWAMHSVWVSYRHTMDRRVLDEVLYPTLAKALNFYLKFLVEGNDGKLHLPLTRSPEYADAADCTYDLSLIRWAGTILPQIAPHDPRVARWRDVAARLTPYRENADGVMIGEGVALTESHRHFSHLLWMHPLREKTWDTPGDRDIMRRSFEHWSSMRSAWAGYSYPAASSMSSLMGQPAQALSYLRFLLDRNVIGVAQVMPNTMYKEGSNLAIESPLTAAQSVLDMLIDSDPHVVKVFPSMPWPDASIAGLRTQGAFLVDASRRNGQTEWIKVRSEAGEPLVLSHGIAGDLDVRAADGSPLNWRQAGPGRIAIQLDRGRTAVVTRSGTSPDLRPRDVPAESTVPPWGLP
jgi:alpha-L-fucosidase 2